MYFALTLHMAKPTRPDDRAIKILARTLHKDLRAGGFNEKQIVALATELISNVTTEIGAGRGAAA